MKLIRKGSATSLSITREEWMKLGSSNGWVKTTSSKIKSKVPKFSQKLENILTQAKSRDILTLVELPHIIMVNSGRDTGSEGFAEVLRRNLEKNSKIQTPKLAMLDTSGILARASAERDRVKESASKILTSGNMIWNLTSNSLSTDSLKLLEANSSNFRKSNVWVVIETSD